MKTQRSAAKRFRRTASGKIKRRHAYKSHILEKKSPKRIRNLRQPALVSDADKKRVDRLIPY
jgi:large subunit ribosomal protein L35